MEGGELVVLPVTIIPSTNPLALSPTSPFELELSPQWHKVVGLNLTPAIFLDLILTSTSYKHMTLHEFFEHAHHGSNPYLSVCSKQIRL